MTLQEHIADLGRELATLATAGPDLSLSAGDVHAALTARRSLVPLLGSIVTGVARHPGSPSGPVGGALVPVAAFDAALTKHPVAVLARELSRYPLPASPWGFGNEPAPEPVTAIGRSWLRVGYLSEAAAQEWQRWPPAVEGEARWSAVADVAALAEALSVADGHLAAALRASPLGEGGPAEELRETQRVNLRVAAAETANLAAAGPLPEWADNSTVRPGPSPPKPMTVRSAADLIDAQRTLAEQTSRARLISPATISIVAAGQARILAIAADALQATEPERAARATALAQGMHDASRHSRDLAMLDPSDHRGDLQVSEIARWMAQRRRHGWHDEDRPHLAELVDASPGITRALAGRAGRAAEDGSWLMADPNPHRIDRGWVRLRGRVTPALCSELATLAAHTDSFPTPTVYSRSRPVPPRDALAGVAALRRRERPAAPSAFAAGRSSPLWKAPPSR